MTVNQNLIDVLTELVRLIKLEQNHSTDQKIVSNASYRIKAISYLISIIKKHGKEITNADDIKKYPKIGKGSLAKVSEILETGKLQEVKELTKQYQKYTKMQGIIDELSTIVGIGRSRAIELVEKYNVKSIKDLQKRFKNGEIPLNDKIQIGLKYVGKFEGSIPRTEFDTIADFISASVETGDLTVTFCGSYRRGKSTPNDIDVLICHLDYLTMDDVKKSTVLKNVVTVLKEKKLIIDDIAGEESSTKYMGFCKINNKPVRRLDIRVMPVESYYTAILYFTGSYELNREMRLKAKELGYKLNEYGLYKDDTRIDVCSEEDVFELLKMDYLPPEER